ncbi:MAG: MoaD/ThiS family protein [Clostridiales Family XIII bacterium]|jgi:molybdopterin converting factor small subunit|nr:MoaD/ThiS family protein [Clostridiales Family XIII bacterium]
MAQVLIPTALRAFTEGNSSVDAAGKTVGEVIAAVAEQYPDLKLHLYEENGTIRRYVNIYIGDDNIRNLGGVDAPVVDTDTVMLVPAIAGGVR